MRGWHLWHRPMYVLGTLERWPVNIGLTFGAFVAMAALQRPGTTHSASSLGAQERDESQFRVLANEYQ